MRLVSWSIMSLRFRETLQYRAAAWAGVFTQVVFGFILLMILLAFYASSDVEPPMDAGQLVVYIWLGQALFALMPWGVDRGVVDMVRTGSVAYELARPIDTYWLWFWRTMGWRLAVAVSRGVPLTLIVGIVFPVIGLSRWALPGPASAGAFAAFAVAITVSVLLVTAITMLMHVVILWTLDPEGVARIAPAFVMLFSGMIIPLPLFPDFMQPLLMALPFRGLMDVPLRLYSGHIPTSEALPHILLALVWGIALVAFGRWMMERGLRQIVVQGG